MKNIETEFKKIKGKWNIHIVHNSHTDLGYTHRSEWVYRAHSRYISEAIKLAEKNEKFIWSIENYWMIENYLRFAPKGEVEKLKGLIKSGQMELSRNYFNATKLIDTDILRKKAKLAAKFSPHDNFAVFQDINGIGRDYAKALADGGVEYILGNIHTHHGMFAGSGKQRPFYWDLGNGKKVMIWNGEYYMMASEFGLWGGEPRTYTLGEHTKNLGESHIESGAIRLARYLAQLEDEKYPFENLVLHVSGTLLDNSAPSKEILRSIEDMQKFLPENVKVSMSGTKRFFDLIDKEIKAKKIDVPTFKGEWVDWWDDGVTSTPEALRIFREAQRIYNIVKAWNNNHKHVLSNKLIEELEDKLALFAEHTWGHMSSVTDPFANENNLLLARKMGMANRASEIAWELLDEIREREGENFIQLGWSNKVVVKNPYNKEMTITCPLQINQFIEALQVNTGQTVYDNYEIVDESGRKYETLITHGMNGVENTNYLGIRGIHSLLTKVKLNPLEKVTLSIIKKDQPEDSGASSFFPICAERIDDIAMPYKEAARFNGDGIETNYFKIEWKIGEGVTSVYDKQKKKELLTDKGFFHPIYDISPSPRNKMAHNRKGPDFIQSVGKLVGAKSVYDTQSTQVVELTYTVGGTTSFRQMIRITNLEPIIDINVRIQKTITTKAENLYINVPVQKDKKVFVDTQEGEFQVWKDQIPGSCIDYANVHNGVWYEEKDGDGIGISAPDTPIFQTGAIVHKRREIMNQNLDHSNMESMFWIMTNYWETNFKGSLEGNYLFAWKVYSGSTKDARDFVKESNKQFVFYSVFPGNE